MFNFVLKHLSTSPFARTDPFLIILITIVLLYFRFHCPPSIHFIHHKNKMKYLETKKANPKLKPL